MRVKTALFMLVLLSGCVLRGDHLVELRAKTPSGDSFPQALASEYLAYAEARLEEGHPLRADYFAGKGLSALAGESVPLEKKSSLDESREALLAVLTPDIIDIAPARAARAQLMFDCWAEKEGVCKEGFAEALTDLQFIADALVHGEDNRFAMTFAPGVAAIDVHGDAILDIIGRRVAALGEYQVEILPVDKTKKRTNARVLAIEKGLIARGVNAGRIHSHHRSKTGAVSLSTDDRAQGPNSILLSIQTYGQPKESTTP
ncbi:MAG: hypothetical protein SFX19_04880 [Alphaproteobacteria bacterium]|nr:hypothetical protein [Alphaproteobacteria bacterium]